MSEKLPNTALKKMSMGQKNTFIHTETIQGSPSGCVRREIPGGTQVDEKGHEGNTAVVRLVLIGTVSWKFFSRRNYNFNVEFDRAYVRSIYDGGNFSRSSKRYTVTFQSASEMGRIFLNFSKCFSIVKTSGTSPL